MKEENKENQYLEEDQDILNSLDSIRPVYMGQEHEQNLASLQIKSILRNRKSMVDLDKSTSRYSLVLIIFAMIQIVIALSQFMFDATTSTHKWIALGIACFIAFSIWFIFKEFDLDKILKK